VVRRGHGARDRRGSALKRLARSRERARSREDGYAAVELALGVGVLLFPIAVLVLTVPAWSERQAAARAVAREIARAAAQSGVCDPGRAARIATEMADGLGIGEALGGATISCAAGRPLPRGGEVTATVTVRMPVVAIPGLVTVSAFAWTTSHREPVDPYGSAP